MSDQIPSQDTLQETPDRAGKFLRAASQNPEILAVLGTRGYSAEVHQIGWQRYLEACNAPVASAAPSEPTSAAKHAIATLSREDAIVLAIIDAALREEYPGQGAFVVDGLKDQEGSGAVANVATVLARIAELEAGRSDATRAADREAVRALDGVRFDAAERQRLGALVSEAQSWDALAVASAPARGNQRFEAQKPKLLALYLWYRKWADIASAIITQKSLLISLGLAKRKKAEKKQTP